MKSADIKPGEVYAYQESSYRTPDEIVFLTPLTKDHIYQPDRYWKPGRPHYTRQENETRPRKNTFYGNIGWLVAIGTNVLNASLEEATSTNVYPEARGYSYQILVQTTKVTGIYTEVVAARKAAEDRDREIRRRRQEECEAATERWLVLKARLEAAGVQFDLIGHNGMTWNDTEYTRKNSPPRAVRLTYEQAGLLAEHIALLKEVIG